MCQFIETIQIVDGNILHPQWHKFRMKRTIEHFFGCNKSSEISDIQNVLAQIPFPHGLLKCRILYSSAIENIEYFPYTRPQFQKFRLIHCDDIEYSFKFAARADIEELFGKRGNADEIIIVKNECITDTSIANLVFFDGKHYFTPDTPLLRGTRRERMLDEGIIAEKRITIVDLTDFVSFFPINAMSPETPEILYDISQIEKKQG